jgi:hypothetical protein
MDADADARLGEAFANGYAPFKIKPHGKRGTPGAGRYAAYV